MSHILLLYKTWGHYNKFDSTKLRFCYWCIQILQCRFMGHELKLITFYAQNDIAVFAICHDPRLVRDKPQLTHKSELLSVYCEHLVFCGFKFFSEFKILYVCFLSNYHAIYHDITDHGQMNHRSYIVCKYYLITWLCMSCYTITLCVITL